MLRELIRDLACMIFGHYDPRLVSANPRDGALYHCLHCDRWWIEEA